MSDHESPFPCPECGHGNPKRTRGGCWVKFVCPKCKHSWSHKFRHVAGPRGYCSVCGSAALKTPTADYEDECGKVWHVPALVGRVLCYRHGYCAAGKIDRTDTKHAAR